MHGDDRKRRARRRTPWAARRPQSPAAGPDPIPGPPPVPASGSSWEKLARRYVWNEQKTSFFVAVPSLNQGQARSEMLVFGIFLGTPFLLVLLGAFAQISSAGTFEPVAAALYAASVLGAIGALWVTRHWIAALWCLTAPAAILIYGLVHGHGASMATIDRLLLMLVLGAWAYYTTRIVAIARAYPAMPPPPPAMPRRGF